MDQLESKHDSPLIALTFLLEASTGNQCCSRMKKSSFGPVFLIRFINGFFQAFGVFAGMTNNNALKKQAVGHPDLC